MSKMRIDTETCGECRYFHLKDPGMSEENGDCYVNPETVRCWKTRRVCRHFTPIPFGDPDSGATDAKSLPEKLW